LLHLIHRFPSQALEARPIGQSVRMLGRSLKSFGCDRATMSSPSPSLRVRRKQLAALHPLDGALELMFFALKGLTREADEVMAARGLSRAHHRALFIIARADAIHVGELAAMLGVSTQALHRTLNELQRAGLVTAERDPTRHRYKVLRLTAEGRSLEAAASDCERNVVKAAFDAAPEAAAPWALIMEKVSECA